MNTLCHYYFAFENNVALIFLQKSSKDALC